MMRYLVQIDKFYGRDCFKKANEKYKDRNDVFYVFGGNTLAMEDDVTIYSFPQEPQTKKIEVPTPMADMYTNHIATHGTKKDPQNCPTCFYEELNQ